MPRAEGSGAGPSGTGGRQGQPVGSVAEEAARLVQSLSSWADGGEERRGRTGGEHRGPDGEEQPGLDGEEQPGPDGATARCTCSCHRSGASAACRVCPICQGIALLRSIRPETLERVADVAAMAAAALQDLAEQRRQTSEEPPPEEPPAEEDLS